MTATTRKRAAEAICRWLTRDDKPGPQMRDITVLQADAASILREYGTAIVVALRQTTERKE